MLNLRLRGTRQAAAVAAMLAVLAPVAAAHAAGADTITVHERGVDINPGDQNPCTGVIGTVVDVNDIHFHVTTLPDGTVNETGHNTAEVTFIPDDPTQPTYEGHETYAISQSTSNRHMVTTTTFHVRMKGSDGGFIDLREAAHMTVNQNGATASFDAPTLSCS
jgi:hypothetical protein